MMSFSSEKSYTAAVTLRQQLDPELLDVHSAGSASPGPIGGAPTVGDETARSTGTAIAVAVGILQCTDIAIAGENMRWLIGK
jgi:hypothetical protein